MGHFSSDPPPPRRPPPVDVLCIGETLWDARSSADPDQPPALTLVPGGGAWNVARALAARAFTVTLCAPLGDDVLGRLFLAHAARTSVRAALAPPPPRPAAAPSLLRPTRNRGHTGLVQIASPSSSHSASSSKKSGGAPCFASHLLPAIARSSASHPPPPPAASPSPSPAATSREPPSSLSPGAASHEASSRGAASHEASSRGAASHEAPSSSSSRGAASHEASSSRGAASHEASSSRGAASHEAPSSSSSRGAASHEASSSRGAASHEAPSSSSSRGAASHEASSRGAASHEASSSRGAASHEASSSREASRSSSRGAVASLSPAPAGPRFTSNRDPAWEARALLRALGSAPDARVVLLSGLLPHVAFLERVRRFLARARARGAFVIVDLNARPRVWARASSAARRAALEALAPAHFIKSSPADEAALGLASGAPQRAPAVWIRTNGPAPVVVRAYGAPSSLPVQPVAVSDATGAGDVFVAGVIEAMLTVVTPDGAPDAVWKEAILKGISRAHEVLAGRVIEAEGGIEPTTARHGDGHVPQATAPTVQAAAPTVQAAAPTVQAAAPTPCAP